MAAAQELQLRQLAAERDIALKPLQDDFKRVEVELSAAFLANPSSVELADIRTRLQAAAAAKDDMSQKYKKLEAEMKAKHAAQESERE
eukprot:1750375-Prymnesium_polylepis.1